MKKLIALLAVCGFAMAFVACGKKAETAETTVDSAAMTTDEVMADTTTMDTVGLDSTAH